MSESIVKIQSPPLSGVSRRDFAKATLMTAGGLALDSLGSALKAAETGGRRIRTAVIGCGSVSNQYLPVLQRCPFVELVSVCDIRPERARRQSEAYRVPHHYPHIEALLAGAPFEFLIDLTDMQAHEAVNRRALQAGKHVWSEKPIANSLKTGQELLRMARQRGLRLWGAPITVQSPQFAFMARKIASGDLGRLAAAHAFYGHEGPDWSSFFYEKGGGSLPDLAVYNLTSLTGMLGPVRRVTALLSIVTPERTIHDKGTILVTEEDNAMVLLDHGRGVISHVQSGFNYFNPHGHDGSGEKRHTIQVTGSRGYVGLVGYDWAPQAVEWATVDHPQLVKESTDPGGYLWQQGAALAAECLATGKELLATPEQALHVLEIITAARTSSATGRTIPLRSTFRWPLPV